MGLGVVGRLDLIDLEGLRLIDVKLGEGCLDDALSAIVHAADNATDELVVVYLTVSILVEESEDGGLLFRGNEDSIVL